MDQLVIEDTVEQKLRLPWSTICKIACAAFIQNKTFDELVNHMLEAYVTEYPKPVSKGNK